MNDYTIQLTPALVALVPIVLAVLQIAKRIEFLLAYKQWFPLLAVGLAVLIAYVQGIPQPIIGGLMAGLVAAGGYDVIKIGNSSTK